MGIVTHWVSFGSIWSRCASDSWGSCGPRGASITFLAHFAFVSLDIKATGCLVMLGDQRLMRKEVTGRHYSQGGRFRPHFLDSLLLHPHPTLRAKETAKREESKKKESDHPSYLGLHVYVVTEAVPSNKHNLPHKSQKHLYIYTVRERSTFSPTIPGWPTPPGMPWALRTLAIQNKTESVSYIMHARLSPLLADCWHYRDGITDYWACSLCICNHIF